MHESCEPGRIAATQKVPWTTPQGRQQSPTPPRKGCKGAPSCHHQPKTSLPGAHDRNRSERRHRKAADEAAGLHSKKRTVGALERDEGLRTAWRVMIAQELDAPQLVFVDEMG